MVIKAKYKMIEYHRKIWQWLSENPDKEKSDWPEWKHNGGKIDDVINHCFACYYAVAYETVIKYINCEKCLFLWPGYSCEVGETPLYKKWNNINYWEKNIKQRSELAFIIKILPVARNKMKNMPY